MTPERPDDEGERKHAGVDIWLANALRDGRWWSIEKMDNARVADVDEHEVI